MKRDAYKVVGECLVFTLAFAILLGFVVACSGDNDVAGGSSVDSGVIAITNKQIAGVAQKGPFVKGSSVVLRETSANGNLEPTGREYTTVTINDKGDFKFDSLDLESQYVRLSAEGYYIHDAEAFFYFDDDVMEVDPKRSECPMRLDAVSDLRKRETVNINILTHFEYKRVLNLIKSGKSFVQAKKQAAAEVVRTFGVKVEVSSAEDLNIYNTTEADRILFNMSLLLDSRSEWDPWDGEGGEMGYWEHLRLRENVDCSKLQKYLDGFTDDFADDGILDDTLMQSLAGTAYILSLENSNMEDVDDDDLLDTKKVDPESYERLLVAVDEYEFGILLFLDYMGLERCTENLWGEYRQFNRPIIAEDPADRQVKVLKSGYLLCNGFYWELKTKGYIDSLKIPVDHKTGTMTDPRDGHKYKTVSFEYEGKKYEWMAEELKYESDGLYTWTEAMQIDNKYMTDVVDDSLIGETHQGVCPEGWHVSSTEDWRALVDYVGDFKNLLNENWRTSDIDAAFGRDLIGVYYNKFDFNLMPVDTVYLVEVYYHSYKQGSYHMREIDEDEAAFCRLMLDVVKDEEDREEIESCLTPTPIGDYYVEVSPRGYYVEEKPLKEAYVRCVKN